MERNRDDNLDLAKRKKLKNIFTLVGGVVLSLPFVNALTFKNRSNGAELGYIRDGSQYFPDLVGGGGGSGNVEYINIKATSQAEGDLHLSDVTNWNTSKAHISSIRVITSSTDWDLYILQNDNGYVTNDANVPRKQIMGEGNGEETIESDMVYEDEDATGEVHLYFLDNSGSNTADFYIEGWKLA